MKDTQDDWRPNFKNNQVKVILYLNNFNVTGTYHVVCVWGEDDDGREIIFRGNNGLNKTQKLYNKIIKWPFVNKSELKKEGFTRV